MTAPSRQLTGDPRNELHPYVEHYIGIDVGTGSARACIMNDQGDIVGVASENIGLWQPQTGYYVCIPTKLQLQSEARNTAKNDRNNQPQTSGAASARQCAE
jgi:glycerol kinase